MDIRTMISRSLMGIEPQHFERSIPTRSIHEPIPGTPASDGYNATNPRLSKYNKARERREREQGFYYQAAFEPLMNGIAKPEQTSRPVGEWGRQDWGNALMAFGSSISTNDTWGAIRQGAQGLARYRMGQSQADAKAQADYENQMRALEEERLRMEMEDQRDAHRQSQRALAAAEERDEERAYRQGVMLEGRQYDADQLQERRAYDEEQARQKQQMRLDGDYNNRVDKLAARLMDQLNSSGEPLTPNAAYDEAGRIISDQANGDINEVIRLLQQFQPPVRR